jgi:hypothetical protein
VSLARKLNLNCRRRRTPSAIPYRGDQHLGEAVADPNLPPPAVDLAGANIRPPGNLRDHRSRRQALGNNRPLLLGAPPTPPFRASNDFNPRHRRVSCTSANPVACTSAYQPDTPPLRKAAIAGRLRYIYIVDRANTGLHILELTGYARKIANFPK